MKGMLRFTTLAILISAVAIAPVGAVETVRIVSDIGNETAVLNVDQSNNLEAKIDLEISAVELTPVRLNSFD